MRPGALALLLFAVLPAQARADEEVTPPSAQCPVSPVYPPSMRTSGREGAVTVRIEIDPSGKAIAFSVPHGMGSPFDEAALEAARQCTFTAGQRGGQPVLSQAELTVSFSPPPPPVRVIGDVVGELSEPKEGVTVAVGDRQVKTDARGHFELEVPADTGELWFVLSLPGYRDEALEEVALKPGDTRHVRYQLHKEKIRETVVVGSHLLPPPPAVDPTPQVSHFTVSRADIDRTPGAMEDVARVVQDLPGVAADPDLLATFFVRGGGPDEVVYYLDGVPLTNPFHLGGFATLYNPMLIDSADFYAGGAPARYEPALSGVLDVTYATGETTRPHVDADVSLLTAKVRAETPTPIEGLSVMVAARRSYFELYFAGLSKVGLVESSTVAPEITDLIARVNYRKGRHDLTATFLTAEDGLNFINGAGNLINFAAGLDVSNRLGLGSLRDRISLGGASELTLLAALTRDHDHVSVTTPSAFYGTDSLRLDGLFRADLLLALSERNRFSAGVQYARRSLDFTGEVADARDVAPWISTPFVDTYAPNLEIQPAVVHNLLAAYLDDTFHPLPALELAAGGRLQTDLATLQTSYSARAASSYEVARTHTVLKASLGVAAQPNLNPLFLDPTYGTPGLLPERSWSAIAGLEQPLPSQTLVRLEGYGKWLDHLVVNPDSPQGVAQLVAAGQPVFQNAGTGFARGVDLLVLGRTRRFAYGVAYGFVVSERTNPLAQGVQTYPSPWDQRHTAAGHLSFIPAHHWLLSARLTFHTGRPVTPLAGPDNGFFRNDAAGRYEPVFGPTNGARYPAFYEASVRVQQEFKAGPLSMAWYLEVLNVTDAQNLFATVYDKGDYASGTPPQASNFNHLPIRPFVGLRGEY